MNGTQPYPGKRNLDIIIGLQSGMRLERPLECSPPVFALLEQCWLETPSERPSFKTLAASMSDFEEKGTEKAPPASDALVLQRRQRQQQRRVSLQASESHYGQQGMDPWKSESSHKNRRLTSEKLEPIASSNYDDVQQEYASFGKGAVATATERREEGHKQLGADVHRTDDGYFSLPALVKGVPAHREAGGAARHASPGSNPRSGRAAVEEKDKGACTRCGKLVLVTQERVKDGTQYTHNNPSDCGVLNV